MTIIEGKEALSRWQLLVQRSALKLEAKGMRHSSGRSMRALVKRLPGAPQTNDYAKLIAFMDQLLEK